MKVKICGITSPADARMAEEAGADFVGAILVLGSRRQLSAEGARTVGEAVTIPLVVVVAGHPPAAAAPAARTAGASVIQLHGDESPDDLEELRTLGDWELWKAVRVRSGEDLPRALRRFGGLADLLLFDGWHPSELGGTGTSFDWGTVAEQRAHLPHDLRLGVAGGLTPDNVHEAARLLRPALVDVSSGVERAPGVKDPALVSAFIRGVAGSRRTGPSDTI